MTKLRDLSRNTPDSMWGHYSFRHTGISGRLANEEAVPVSILALHYPVGGLGTIGRGLRDFWEPGNDLFSLPVFIRLFPFPFQETQAGVILGRSLMKRL